jgi:type III pantothenate kinase
MLLAVDIGNSSTKFGIFDGEDLVSKFSIHTNRDAGAAFISDEVARRLNQTFEAAIVASVVPEMEPALREYLRLEPNIDPVFVDHYFDFGLKINYKPITAAGIDRLVNASAAAAKYGKPCIVCSFGTATTIDVVSKDEEFLGGIIAPGMQAMVKALHIATSKLPEVEIEKPENLLGNSTVDSIRSGVFYGYVAMVEGLIARISKSYAFTREAITAEAVTLTVAATGGLAEVIAPEIDAITIVNRDLTLEGLRMLYLRHKNEQI